MEIEVMNKNKAAKTISFWDEISQQPAALRRFVEHAFAEENLQRSLERLVQEHANPYIILTGMGSSLFACYVTMKFLQNRGYRACTIESFELQSKEAGFFTSDIIIVAVSQSGESPEVLELLEKLPTSIPVISVTNYPNSHLHTMTELSCEIYAGTEYLTSTKSYTNTLAAMLLLAHRLAGSDADELRRLRHSFMGCADKMAALIADERLGERMACFIADIEFLICIGSGYSYTTACHSEIVAEEAGKFYSSRFTSAQFIHGPIELIRPGFGVLVYDFDRRYSAKCDEVRTNVLQYGGKVLLITNRTDVAGQENQLVCHIGHEDPATATLLEIIPLELGIDCLCNSRGVAAGQLSRVVKRIAS